MGKLAEAVNRVLDVRVAKRTEHYQSTIKELVEALEPIGGWSNDYDDDEADSQSLVVYLTLGQLRKATSALTQAKELLK